MVMHRDPTFFCHLCGRYFHESQNLKKHINTIHSEERPFQCHMCGMNYKRRDVLQEHIRRVHEGIRKSTWSDDMIRRYRNRDGTSKQKPKGGRYQCPHCTKCMARYVAQLVTSLVEECFSINLLTSTLYVEK